MSLINDMLRDLEPESANASARNPKTRNSQVIEPKSFPYKKFILPMLALMAGFYFVLFELNLFQFHPKTTIPIEIPQPVVMNSKWLQATTNTPASTNSAEISGADPVNIVHQAIPMEGQIEIDVDLDIIDRESMLAESEFSLVVAESENYSDAIAQLLAEAERALARDQLMTPAKYNAYQLYNSVLLLEPENQRARRGLTAIQTRYIELAKRAEQSGQQTLARDYLTRAGGIGPLPVEIVADMPFNTHAPEQTEVAEGVIKIEETQRLSDHQLAQRIQTQYHSSLTQQALKKIAAGESLPLTVLALADVFAQTQDLEQLLTLENALGYEQGSLKLYLSAQTMVVRGEFQQAHDTLIQANFTGVSKIPVLRLTSALCQKLGNLQCAEQGYRVLVKSGEAQVGDWLGLAVCLDRLNRGAEALVAYQQVDKFHYQNAQVERFVRQRIADLSSYSYRR